jgi:hypothetical protein
LLLNALAKGHEIEVAAVFSESGHFYVSPVAVLRDKRLSNPVLYQHSHSEAENEQFVKRFIGLHYARNSKFFISQSGQALGEMRLGELQVGCDSDYNFDAKPTGPFRFDNSRGAIALSDDIGKPHADFRTQSAASERSQFALMSQQSLSKSHPSVTAKTRWVIHHLIGTKVAENGGRLLVGSISFLQKRREYWMFVVLEQHGQTWLPGVAEVHVIDDLEDRTDAQQEEFFDQLDVDGDGTDEIFTESTYYEAYSFDAYAPRNGAWKRIYASGLGGC